MDYTIKLGSLENPPEASKAYKVMFVIMSVSVTSAVTFMYNLDVIESFTRTAVMVTAAVAVAVFFITMLFSPSKKIKKRILIVSLVLAVLSFFIIEIGCDFTIKKWQEYPKLRPLMAWNLDLQSRKSAQFVDYKVSKELTPDFLELYSREELREIFGEPEELPSEHVTVSLGEYSEYVDYDIVFGYTDYNGKNYWLVIFYVRNRADGNRFTKLQEIEIVREGTAIDRHVNYAEESE